MAMRVGGRRHKVKIEKAIAQTADEYGEVTDKWKTFKQVYVSIEPQGGREYNRAQQVTPELTRLLGMEWVADVKEEMRVNLNGRFLYIAVVENVDERNRDIFLSCIEQVE